MIIAGLGNIGKKRAHILQDMELVSYIDGVDPYVDKDDFDFPVYDTISEAQRSELAIVCTPPTVRLEVIKELAARHVNCVLVEKPMATTAAEAQEIREAAGDMQVYQVANWMFSPIYHAISLAIPRPPNKIMLYATGNIKKWSRAIYRQQIGARGVMWDMLPHSLYLLEYLTGELIEELSYLETDVPELHPIQPPHRVMFRGMTKGGIVVGGHCVWDAPYDQTTVLVESDEGQFDISFNPRWWGKHSLEQEMIAFVTHKWAPLGAGDALRHLKLLEAWESLSSRA